MGTSRAPDVGRCVGRAMTTLTMPSPIAATLVAVKLEIPAALSSR